MKMHPPIHQDPYGVHSKMIADASVEVVLENMLAASIHLHNLHGVDPMTTLDIAVTCDGTWSKRGFTATYGVVVVIAWDTGEVLYFQILSKRCGDRSRWCLRIPMSSRNGMKGIRQIAS